MQLNLQYINQIIELRNSKNDPVIEFAIRNKASPVFSDFKPFNQSVFNVATYIGIDGGKLKFKYTTLTINTTTR